ncbi:MAG: cysteine desulfurase family protein [Ancalomicrobiaceae bacterium]|nr:cysteine desulfurase family protein [Ancalomicrobiaceae bacterium]
MPKLRLYLDHNATAPLRPEARAAVVAALDTTGNASSVHAEGREARKLVEAARSDVAALVGARPSGLIFTSGATEANVMALSPVIRRLGREVEIARLLVSAVEHPSVLRGGRFLAEKLGCIAVDAQGVVDLDDLRRQLADVAAAGGTALVAIQLANNETGVIQPVAAAAKLTHEYGGVIHCDAVQAAGRIPVDAGALDVDSLALSAHKLGGLQGMGALITLGGFEPLPLIVGGGQEGWRRAGTEPVAAIAGFAAAARVAAAEVAEMAAVARRRDRLEAALVAQTPDAVVFSADAVRLPNTLALAVLGVAAETAVIAFDLASIALSSGSACSSGKVAASHVLKAMGVEGDLVRGGLRMSIGAATSDADIDRMIAAWGRVMRSLRQR